MRHVAVVIIWILCLGTVQAYLGFVDRLPRRDALVFQQQQAQGLFAVEIETTFQTEGDDFTGAPALDVSINGQQVIKTNDTLPSGQAMRLEDVRHVVVGRNEFFVKASSAPEEQLEARAVQIRVFRDQHPIAQHTLWATAGTELGGTFELEIPDQEGRTHEHDHSDASTPQ